MKTTKLILASFGFILIALFFTQCQQENLITNDDASLEVKKYKPPTESAGNNLSFPVIWSDGFELDLREPPIVGPQLEDEWWYVWGEDPIDPNYPVYSCKPLLTDPTLCDNGLPPGDGSSTIYKAYLQKRNNNIWQAYNESVSEPLNVDLIDWGDNLESVDWNIRSQVRTELVLFENLDVPVVQYAMRHVSGWGTTEMHGLQTELNNDLIYGPGDIATVYSHNSRFTIQKLNIDRDSIVDGSLTWIPREGWTETDPNSDNIINQPIFNLAVYEGSDGPGFYSAEVNIKGKIIYGYTWNVRNLNEGAGYYRLTYSFDETGGPVPLNTFFDEFTEILMPLEEFKPDPTVSAGGVGKIDVANNLTYMDIRIRPKGGGGGGGK